MARKTQTEYTRAYRNRVRRDANVYRELKEIAIDQPGLGPAIREAERRVDARMAEAQAS